MVAAPGAVQPPHTAGPSDDAPPLDVGRAGRPAVVGVTFPVGGRRDGRPEFRCECGHRLSVSGVGRHRVYFELGQRGTDQAIMDRVCPACARGLPGKNPR